MRKLLVFIVFIHFSLLTYAQGILDTVLHIPEVKIRSGSVFDKEEAGMKTTRVDSFLLSTKIHRSLSEVLAENTTLQIKNYGRGALSTASFRGAAVSHTQVSWNGIGINSPMSGIVDFSLIPVHIIDELNLQHGASSIAYRSGGLGGHVSIDNRTDWTPGAGGSLYQGIGSFSTFDEFAQFRLGNRKFQSKTRFYHSFSKNDYTYRNTSLIGAPQQRMDDGEYRYRGLTQEIYLRTAATNTLSAKVWYQDSRRSIPLVMSYEGIDTSIDRQNIQADRTLKAVIDGKFYRGKTTIKMSSGMDLQQLDYLMKLVMSGAGENLPVNSASDMLGVYNSLSVDYELNKSVSAAAKVNYHYFSINTLDSATMAGFDADRHEFSLFGGFYANVFRKMNLSLALRKDYVTGLSTPLIYSAGLSYSPLESKRLAFKAGFARNFHNPSLNHLYWQPGGNPDLGPEEGYTGEAGIHYLHFLRNLSLNTQLTAYYSDISNWILWLPSFKGYWEAQNISQVKSYGVELQTRVEWQPGKYIIRAMGNYLCSRSLNFGDPLVAGDDSRGRQLPFIPEHSGNAIISVSRAGYSVNFQYQYTGIRHLLSSNRIGLLDDSEYFGVEARGNPFYRLYAQHLNHLTLGKHFEFRKLAVNLEFKVYNLFNEVYRNVLNRYMPRRYYTVLLKLDF